MKKIILLIVIFICRLTTIYSQRAGDLDSSFGINGFVTDDSAVYVCIAIQNNGKIVVAGTANNDFALARYSPNGSRDSSFSQDGFQTTHFNSGVVSASSIAIQNDGKIVIAGSVSINGGQYDFALARYNIDGSLDKTFSGDGMQSYDVGAAYTFAQSVVIQSDGKIVVGGYSYTSNINDADFTLARFNVDGSPDQTFSGDGKQTTDFGNNDYIFSVALQSDGKIVAAGYTGDNITNTNVHNTFAVARYNSDGSPDNTFSDDGKQTTDFGFGANGYSLAIQSDGKLLLAGEVFNATYDFALVRYNTDGSPDNTFSDDGKQTTDFGNEAGASSIAIQNNGKIIVGGNVKVGDSRQLRKFALARYSPNGSLDSTFSADGKQTTQATSDDNLIFDLAIANNKLYVIGDGKSGQFLEYFGVVTRYLLDDTNKAPTVTLTTPADNATYTAYAKIKLNADASDANGTISKVEFYRGTTLLHAEYVAPYGYIWDHIAPGIYTVTAKATDNDGNVTTSNTVHISVVPDIAPTVNITSPATDASYTAYSSIILSANANDVDGTVKKVDFYNGSTLLFTEYVAPYRKKWYNVPVGNYFITAKATDNNGKVTTSQPALIFVVPDIAPVVSVTSPANNTTYVAPVTIILSADASDMDGTIKKVDFYNGSTLLFTENDAPYFRSWPDVPEGNYSIIARATDNNGKITTSTPIAISVIAAGRSLVKEDKLNSSKKLLSLNINPNPVDNILNISVHCLQTNSRSTISVLSASGSVIKTIQSGALNKNVQLDVSSLSGGVYFIKVINGDKILYKQFVKL